MNAGVHTVSTILLSRITAPVARVTIRKSTAPTVLPGISAGHGSEKHANFGMTYRGEQMNLTAQQFNARYPTLEHWRARNKTVRGINDEFSRLYDQIIADEVMRIQSYQLYRQMVLDFVDMTDAEKRIELEKVR